MLNNKYRLDSKTIIKPFLGKKVRYKFIDAEGLKSQACIRQGKDIVNV